MLLWILSVKNPTGYDDIISKFVQSTFNSCARVVNFGWLYKFHVVYVQREKSLSVFVILSQAMKSTLSKTKIKENILKTFLFSISSFIFVYS